MAEEEWEEEEVVVEAVEWEGVVVWAAEWVEVITAVADLMVEDNNTLPARRNQAIVVCILPIISKRK